MIGIFHLLCRFPSRAYVRPRISKGEAGSLSSHVDYALTEKGASFANVLAFLRGWGSVYGDFSKDVVLRSKGTRKDDFVMFGHPEEKDDRLGGGDCLLWYMKGFSNYYKPPKIGKDAAPKSGDADAPAEDFQDAPAQEPKEAIQETPAQISAEA